MKGTATRLDVAVGWRVRSLRERSGISQAAMARRLGISFQQLQKYESGKNRISAGRLKMVAELLELPVESFFQSDETDREIGNSTYPTIKEFRETVEGLELMRAFRRIPSLQTRERVLALVKTLAEEERQPVASALARSTEHGHNVVERDFAVAERQE
ncbi:MAG: helix-turn-helix domain-containing protein [Rhizomicrobium sp.]